MRRAFELLPLGSPAQCFDFIEKHSSRRVSRRNKYFQTLIQVLLREQIKIATAPNLWLSPTIVPLSHFREEQNLCRRLLIVG